MTTAFWLSGSLKLFFVHFFCIFLLPLVNILCFCWVHTVLVLHVSIFACNVPLLSLIFLKTPLVSIKILVSSISLKCSLKNLSYLSLLFFGTLHSFEYSFPFLPCLSLLFFSQLFVRPSQTTILPCCISFWGVGGGGDSFGHHFLYNVTNLCP